MTTSKATSTEAVTPMVPSTSPNGRAAFLKPFSERNEEYKGHGEKGEEEEASVASVTRTSINLGNGTPVNSSTDSSDSEFGTVKINKKRYIQYCVQPKRGKSKEVQYINSVFVKDISTNSYNPQGVSIPELVSSKEAGRTFLQI